MDRTARNGGTNIPEVSEKPRRRRFEAAYKLQVLEEADRCTEPGQVGELLRREGLYASHLNTWRRQRDEGSLQGLSPKRRGRKAQRKDAVALENERLRRENQRLAERLRQAETIIEVQQTLETAYATHPERFVRGRPRPPKLPTAVWINPPTEICPRCSMICAMNQCT